MNEADALELIQAALWTTIVASGPPIAAAMIVGVLIALIQAMPQVQEMTLTFVPKMIIIVIVIAVGAPFIGAQVYSFSERVYSRIENGFRP